MVFCIYLQTTHGKYDINVIYPPLLENSTNIRELRGLIKEITSRDIYLSEVETDVNIFDMGKTKIECDGVIRRSSIFFVCFEFIGDSLSW